MTLTKLNLKIVQNQDLPQVLELDHVCLGGMWTLDGYQREIESPNSLLISLELENHIIGLGCMWAILEECHIVLLAVHPDYQGQGLGKLLICSLLKDAVDRKLEHATLEVKANNNKAIALYQKFGFKQAGLRKKYYPTGEDALILWRSQLHFPQFFEQLYLWEQEITHQLSQFNYAIEIPTPIPAPQKA
jgi:ribosomal-protein-alanine N-acetyltransferase